MQEVDRIDLHHMFMTYVNKKVGPIKILGADLSPSICLLSKPAAFVKQKHIWLEEQFKLGNLIAKDGKIFEKDSDEID